MTIARYLPRFRKASRRLEQLERRERWSAGEMKAFQLERLNALWAHATANTRYYRGLAAAQRLPVRFESIDDYTSALPLLKKSAIRRRPEDFLSSRAGAGRWRSTSGSTGVPMRFFASHETHQAILACQYRFRQVWGLDLFDRAAFMNGGIARSIGGLSGALRRAQNALSDRLRNRIRIPVHQLGRTELARQLARIERFAPAYIYGYSRAIHLLALEAADRGFRCDALRVVMMTSEPAFAHMIAAVEKALRVPAVIEYGSTECGVSVYEWRDRKLRVRADRVLLETVPRQDGRFDIVKTVLDNFDFPLLRYRIEDVTDAPLATDEAFPILHNIAGRNDDVLYAADGSAIHPAEIDGIFESTNAPAVRRYRLHQSANGNIAVQIEPLPAAAPDLNRIRAAIGRLVPGQAVHIDLVDHLEQTPTGKHRLITSDVTPASRGDRGSQLLT